MESAKGTEIFKFDRFDVALTIFSDKKLAITVTDPLEKLQFHQGNLTLTHIGVNTLKKALTQSLIEVKMGMTVEGVAEDKILKVEILVASQFLRPVQETLIIKKLRDVSESEILKNAINSLSAKIKALKSKQGGSPNTTIKGSIEQGQKSYTGNNYESFASIKLPKGKYLLTVSFLLKATNQWMYVYFNNGHQMMQNCGFYVPNSSQFMPFTLRHNYTVNGNEETINFNTYCAQSYPVTVRNTVATAQRLE